MAKGARHPRAKGAVASRHQSELQQESNGRSLNSRHDGGSPTPTKVRVYRLKKESYAAVPCTHTAWGLSVPAGSLAEKDSFLTGDLPYDGTSSSPLSPSRPHGLGVRLSPL